MRKTNILLAAAVLLGVQTSLLGVQTSAFAQDRAFTIAAIPDTQNYIDYTHQTAEGFKFDANKMFLDQMAYIAANLESNGGDIAFVTALGDVWQHQTLAMDPGHAARGFKRAANPILDKLFAPTPKVLTVEIATARKGYDMIAGKTPFSVVPGNHDYDAMWTDSEHPPAAKYTDAASLGMLHPGGLDNFRSLFGADKSYFKDKKWYVASHDGGADSAQIFNAGGYTFLHIGLQFDAPDASLEWAAKVVAEHPGLPTIVSTHDYMTNTGERVANPMIDGHAVDPQDNNPQMVWDKFISQHDQIFLVLCGHQHGQALRVDNNRAGHPVWQVLADYQDRHQTAIDAGVAMKPGAGIGDGWLRLMTFDMGAATPTMSVRTYSTHYRKQSSETLEYSAWYKAAEKPNLTDSAFHGEDEFKIDLTGFRTRFGNPQPLPAG